MWSSSDALAAPPRPLAGAARSASPVVVTRGASRANVPRQVPPVVRPPKSPWERAGAALFVVFLVLSLAFHLGTWRGVQRLGGRAAPVAKKSTKVEVAVVDKPKPPPPKPPSPLEPPKPKPVVKMDKPRPKPVENLPPPPPDVPPPPPDAAPPPPNQEAKAPTDAPPVFIPGLSLDSTSATGSFSVSTGNTLYGAPSQVAAKPEDVKPYKAERYAAQQYLSEMPRCEPVDGDRLQRDYPKEARDSDTEGEVVTKLVIDDDGSIAEVKIVSGPGFGLEAATKRILLTKGVLRCKPGTVNGQAVATEIKFVMRWELGD